MNDIPVSKADGLDAISTSLLKLSFTFIAYSNYCLLFLPISSHLGDTAFTLVSENPTICLVAHVGDLFATRFNAYFVFALFVEATIKDCHTIWKIYKFIST